LKYSRTVYQPFIEFKNTCDSGSRKVLYNIATEYDVLMEQDRLIGICLDESYSKVSKDKYFSDA